jgi:predicted small lipoprotein YifL
MEISQLVRRLSPSRALALAALAALTLGVAGCGRAGDLEPPPDATAAAKPADSNGEPQVHKKVPPITPPKGPFILDPLL